MAMTNFSVLQAEQKLIWAKDTWKQARNMSFINKFAGTGPNACVQRVTELRKDEKGTRAIITLVADLAGDGIVGDNTLEGNEEAIRTFDQIIQIDQLRHANRHQGKMAEQRSVVSFRNESRDVLAYWLADRIDQMAFLTMAGLAYSNRNSGGTRVNSQLVNLAFAGDVTAPTANRHRRWVAATPALAAGATGSVAAGDTPSYKMIVELKAYARTQYIRGIRGPGGEEFYHLFMTPQGMAKLKLDPDYIANQRNAGVRGDSNALFAGNGQSVVVDGVVIHEFRHVYNTANLAGGSKWGSGGAIEGQAAIFCGAQALGMADIGDAEWNEKEFDYGNAQGIAMGKIFGFKKPVFTSSYTNTTEDFGLIRIDTAI